MDGTPGPQRRERVRVRGLVQGVGFRPHVWRLARRHGLTGFVLNDEEGVLLEAQGPALEAFRAAIVAEAPPLARVDAVEAEELAPIARDAEFRIAETPAPRGRVGTAITADVAPCADCLAELFTPGGRRHLHPFISCVACGPRYTAVESLPYDRARTSFRPFPLCEPCAGEYADPADRRFHAETTCCTACGPKLDHTIAEAAEMVARGGVIALMGVGGFHLICDATNTDAVKRLRQAKRRDGKPFAVLVSSLEDAGRRATLDPVGAGLLAAPERPVVLLPQARDSGLAAELNPGLDTIGLMLPPSPLHWLLLHALNGAPADPTWHTRPTGLALVCTSGNLSGEPVITDAGEARARLGPLVDLVLAHDRAIVTRCDDSVVRVMAGAPSFVRRSRGYSPRPIPLAADGPPVLALGALLKTTVTVTRGREAFLSEHVGDLDSARAIEGARRTAAHLLDLLDVRPEIVAHDLHPDAPTTRIAEAFGLPTLPVQHHHAHVAAIAAEHRHEGPLLGIALDGFGLGSDGGAWGGELLLVEGARFRRLGHLAELPEPGGDRAAREPWRMAAAALHRLGRGHETARRFPGEPQAAAVARLIAKGIASAPTTSAGRLFDAIAGLLGVSHTQAFEGEAAMRLEALVRRPRLLPGGYTLEDGVLDVEPLLAVCADGVSPDIGADLTHGTLAAGLAHWAMWAAETTGVRTVALGGGVFLNRVLTEATLERLAAVGLNVLIARQAPPNDGGLSLGQAWVARQALAAGG